ncbi:TPA: hypothetical protein JG832_002411 [Enterobacter hormaechei subsp. xiangfangensis]|nr:hypothetical protein [Enterobacter hormaechei subsp. xiangfangensis]HAV1890548.1 hypothetical protein [Enterobacter hormaechei subsp. xiangfangensis]
MADKSGKPDWQEHAKRFKELSESKGMKIKEYAAQYGLNENSARRAINTVIKSWKNGDQKSDQNKSDHQPSTRRGRPPKQPEATPGKASRKSGEGQGEAAHTSSGTGDHELNGPKARTQFEKNGDQKKRGKKPDLKVIIGEVLELPKSKAGAPKGNRNRLTTGSAKRINEDDIQAALLEMFALDIPEGVINKVEQDMLTDLLAHHHMIKVARNKSLKRLTIEQLEYEANPPVLKSDDPDGVTILPTPPEFKMLKMLNDTGYSLANIAGTISQLRARIDKEIRDKALHAQKTEQATQKLKQADEAHQLRMYGKMKGDVIGEALDIMNSPDGSAIAAAQYLEKRGIPIPETIRRMVDIEIEQEKNKVDESKGISDEELDAYVAAAEAKRAGHHQWLAEKRQIVADIVDGGGYGDLDEDGVRRSDEIQAPFEAGEEPDLSATADMYNDAPTDIEDEGHQLTPEQEDAALWKGEDRFYDEDEEDDADESIDNWGQDNEGQE